MERVLFGRRFAGLEELLRSLETRHSAAAEREQAASLALETEEAQMEARRTGLYAEEGRLEEIRGRLNELTLAVDRHQGRSGYCKEQIADAESRADAARQEAAELEARVAPLTVSLDGARAEEARLSAELDAAEAEARSAEAGLQDRLARQAATETGQEAAREQQITTLGRIAALQNARESVSGNAERASADLLKLAAETDELQRERTRVTTLRDDAEVLRREADALLAELGQGRAAATSRGDAARAKAEACARDAEAMQSERDSLAGRLASLQEMVATHSAFDEGVRALLQKPEGLEVLGVVADAMETDSDHERAVEAFMGDRLQAVLTPDAATAIRGIRYLRASGAGRGTFLPLRSARHEFNCECLREVQRAEPRVKALLSDLYRVSGPYALRGPRLASERPGVCVSRGRPRRAVAPAGHPVRDALRRDDPRLHGRGWPRGQGPAGAPARDPRAHGAPGRDRAGSRRRRAVGQAEQAGIAESAFAEARGLEGRIHSAEKELVAIRHDLGVAAEELTRIDRKAAVLDTERRQAEEERGAAAVRLAEIEQALVTAEAERLAGTERLAALGVAVAEARAATDAAQVRSPEERASNLLRSASA